jgi:uncharacterized protein YjdB
MLILARCTLAVTVALLVSGCSDTVAPAVNSVTIDRHTATLWSGDVLATSVTVSKTNGEVVANPSVKYTSSDERVATVDSAGKVYAHVAGQTTISAAVGPIADALSVTVLWPPVAQVVFRDDSLALSVGDTFTTWVTVLNVKGNWATNATLTYTSSAPSVATVDGEGRVTAVGEGRAVITATAEHISDVLPVTVSSR